MTDKAIGTDSLNAVRAMCALTLGICLSHTWSLAKTQNAIRQLRECSAGNQHGNVSPEYRANGVAEQLAQRPAPWLAVSQMRIEKIDSAAVLGEHIAPAVTPSHLVSPPMRAE